MKKLDLTTVPQDIKPNPIFNGLPEHLKDPLVFEDIEKKLNKVLISDHKHKTVSEFVKCKRCEAKRHKRNKLIREIGFNSYEQYLVWKKIMNIIINKKSFQLR